MRKKLVSILLSALLVGQYSSLSPVEASNKGKKNQTTQVKTQEDHDYALEDLAIIALEGAALVCLTGTVILGGKLLLSGSEDFSQKIITDRDIDKYRSAIVQMYENRYKYSQIQDLIDEILHFPNHGVPGADNWYTEAMICMKNAFKSLSQGKDLTTQEARKLAEAFTKINISPDAINIRNCCLILNKTRLRISDFKSKEAEDMADMADRIKNSIAQAILEDEKQFNEWLENEWSKRSWVTDTAKAKWMKEFKELRSKILRNHLPTYN